MRPTVTQEPVVSVCVPVRNGEEHLHETLQSVLVQRFADFELVVSDNASTDGTPDLVRRLGDPRIRLLENERDIGGIANWNRVAAAARGRYVKLLAADDLLHPDALALQVPVLEDSRNAGVSMVASRRDIVDEHGRVLLRARGLGDLRGRVPAAQAVRATVRSGTNLFGEPHVVLFRRELLPSDGAFRAERSYMVDLDLWCRLLEGGDLYALPQAVGAFRVHAAAESVRVAAQQAAQAATLFRDLERAGRVSRADRSVGVARARLLAVARRATYRLLRARARG
jgi:glycosyltransferase involved in cell wall biosynthesis